MKAEDLKGKSEDELNKMLLDLRKEQLNQRFQKSGGQLANTSEVRKTRRSIARVKTALTAGKSGTTGKATAKKATKTTKKTATKKTKAA